MYSSLKIPLIFVATALFVVFIFIFLLPKKEEPRRIYGKKTTTAVVGSNNITSSNDVILVFHTTGDWKIDRGNGIWDDDHANYEIFYTKSTNTYVLKLEGYEPKRHKIYRHIVSNLMIDINHAVMDGYSHNEIREMYIVKTQRLVDEYEKD